MNDPKAFLAQLEKQHRAADDSYRGRAIRAADEAFKLGRWERATKSFNPIGRSGNSEISESADLMHRRTRNSYLNNPQIKRLTDVLRDIIVGNGINTFSDPIDHSFGLDLQDRIEQDLILSLNYALESDDRFLEFASDPKQCDVENRLSWFDMQRLILSENVLTGSVLVMECSSRDKPLCFQLIEREQIDLSKDRPAGRDSNAIINGFEIDDLGREVGVYLYDAHPHESYASFSSISMSSTFVPVSRYQHVFKKYRPSQYVGATWLHATGQTTVDRNTYLESEIATAVKQSMVALVANLENPNQYSLGFGDENDDPDPLGRPEISMGHSPLAAELGLKEDLKLVEANRPNDSANDFFDLIDHDAAGACNVSYYSSTGRFEKTNYGGFRGAMNLEDAQTRPIQNWLGRTFVLPVRRRFNQIAVATGQVKRITASQFRREIRRLQRFDCIGPGRNLLDPEKENEASIGQLRGALSTLKIECARRGLNYIAVLRQKAIENKIASVLGIVLDFSKGQGGQVNESTTEKNESSEAESLAAAA